MSVPSPVTAQIVIEVRDLVEVYRDAFEKALANTSPPQYAPEAYASVADKFGVSVQSVKRYLFLLELPEAIRNLVYEGRVGITTLRHLQHIDGELRDYVMAWLLAPSPLFGLSFNYDSLTQNELRLASNRIQEMLRRRG